MFGFMQAVWKVTGARWSPVWTVCPALWSGSLQTTAACFQLPMAPSPLQQTRPVRPQLPGQSSSPHRPPARTRTWSIKSYRPSQLGLYHPDTHHRSFFFLTSVHTSFYFLVWKVIPARKTKFSVKDHSWAFESVSI